MLKLKSYIKNIAKDRFHKTVNSETTTSILKDRRSALQVMMLGAVGAATLPVRSVFGKESGFLARGDKKVAVTPDALSQLAPKISSSYPYQLPALPFAHNALEPVISQRIMELHHGKHHAGYTKKLNAALKDYPYLQKVPLTRLLSNLYGVPKKIRKAVRNNGGGYFNHALFWETLSPYGGGAPVGELSHAIQDEFGSFDAFKSQFSKAAKTLFGSGWAWLTVSLGGRLEIFTTPNQDTPLKECLKPVFGIDVWEHAYYLQYENRRAAYVDAFWDIVNWEQCNTNYLA